MYGSKRYIGGKLGIYKPQVQVSPLGLGLDNVVSKRVEEVQQPLANNNNEKIVINNSLETRRTEPIKKTRNEKIMKFINFQI
jgi:hypothetical protein